MMRVRAVVVRAAAADCRCEQPSAAERVSRRVGVNRVFGLSSEPELPFILHSVDFSPPLAISGLFAR